MKFINLYKNTPNKDLIFRNIKSLIENNNLVGGKEVKNFEKNFSKYVKSKYCISVANGTDALEIAIESLNLPKNSEAIVPVNTWISTAEAVIRNGLKLVFCDINPENYTIDINDLKKRITKKTKLILPVHLYGIPSTMKEIIRIAKKNNIRIVEDCAQAHGSKINNKHMGTFGDLGAFSFFPSKNLGCFGDGGAIITNNKKIETICRRIKNHGSLYKHDHKIIGRNSRLDSIQASVLNVKLKHYEKALKIRIRNSSIYSKNFKKINELSLYKVPKNYQISYHQYVIRLNKNRDKLMKYLNKKNIETMVHYPKMLNELNIFKKYVKKNQKFLNSKKLGSKILSLPISEDHNEKDIKKVINLVKSFFNKK